MRIDSRLTSRLGIQPLIQAPMAGVSTPELAAAVSNAGALGSIAIGASSVTQAQAMIRRTRQLTERPFNVNVFAHAPAARDPAREAEWLRFLTPLFADVGATPPAVLHEIYPSALDSDEVLAMVRQEQPAVVSLHFGLLSAAHIQSLRQAGIQVWAGATSLAEALRCEHAGVDAIIAQGIEAGGHRGIFDPDALDEELDTLALLRELVPRVDLPVIAAGGIMDGQGIQTVLSRGAAAAQLGTAFVLCPESAASAAYRAALHSARAASTRMTRVLSGRPARGLVNRLIAFAESPGAPQPPAYPVAYDAAKQLAAADALRGGAEFAAQWAGQGATRARALPAAQLVSTLLAELRLAAVR